MCDSPPGENDDNSIVSGGSTIYSTPVAQLGSTNDLAAAATSPPSSNLSQTQSSNQMKDKPYQTTNSSSKKLMNNIQSSNALETQTGNKDVLDGDVDSQHQLHNLSDAYRSPTSQRRPCSANRVGGTVRKIYIDNGININTSDD